MVGLKSIDERAGAHRMEVLTFMLQDKTSVPDAPLFGINVFKVRELIVVPTLVEGPNRQDFIAGSANIRGKAVPVIDLNAYFGANPESECNILVVTEFNGNTQGFLVHEVREITEIDWSEVQEPPEIVTELAGQKRGDVLTAMSKLDNGHMLLIVDVEQIISRVLGSGFESIDTTDVTGAHEGEAVFFVDDSRVARSQIAQILDKMGIQYQSAKNGEQAWQKLSAMAADAEESGHSICDSLKAVITDVEMPKMDGYVLTEKIKADHRFDGVPVLMHSSLSARENERRGVKAGVDAYITKLRPKEFSQALSGLIAPMKEAG